MMWPKQSDCDEFYGNPRGVDITKPNAEWERRSLVLVKAPFVMRFLDKPIRGVRIHEKCAASLTRVLCMLWDEADRKQEIIDAWGVSIFGGSYNYRLMRGINQLSMHSYGCAIDLDPARNGLGKKPRFSKVGPVVRSFEKEGWVWGGDWSRQDGMHFQAARVG